MRLSPESKTRWLLLSGQQNLGCAPCVAHIPPLMGSYISPGMFQHQTQGRYFPQERYFPHQGTLSSGRLQTPCPLWLSSLLWDQDGGKLGRAVGGPSSLPGCSTPEQHSPDLGGSQAHPLTPALLNPLFP